MRQRYIKGYKGYTIKWLEECLFRNIHSDRFFSFFYDYPRFPVGRFIENIQTAYAELTTDLLNDPPEFTTKFTTPSKGSKLYYDPCCTIPKKLCSRVFKKVLSPNKADAVVIPRIKCFNSLGTFYLRMAVYKHEATKSLLVLDKTYIAEENYLQETLHGYIKRNNDCFHSSSLSEKNIASMLATYGDAYCIYSGPVVFYHPSIDFIFEVLEDKYNKIVYEDTINKMVKEEIANVPTVEIIESAINMINSDSINMKMMGLMTLASLDYEHYPTVIKYAIDQSASGWRRYTHLFNTQVSYMMRSLQEVDEFYEVQDQEVEIACALYKKKLEQDLQDWLIRVQDDTNLKVDALFTISVKKPVPNLFTK